MRIDLEDSGAAAEPVRRSRVCIIGAGVAGLVLATRLAARGVTVHLLEGGGSADEDRSQSLYNAAMAARHHAGTTEGRFRLFGGSSTRWGGQLLPFTPDVFHPPAGTPSDGWPIDNAVLEPYFAEAEHLMQADHLPFDGEAFLDAMHASDRPSASLLGEAIRLRFSKWAPFAARNLAATLGAQAATSEHATLFLHANVTEILLSPDSTRAEAVLVRNFRGERFRFEADEIVLAAGTIESSRLLLLSRSIQPDGIGNAHDRVGRGFHDHVSLPVGTLRGSTRARMLAWFAPFLVAGTTHSAKLEAADELRSREGLPAVMAHITLAEPEGSGAGVVRDLLRAMQSGNRAAAFRRALPQLPGAAVGIVRMAWAMKVRKRRAVSQAATVTLRIDSEQPHSTNRISLHPAETDALGLSRAIVDWSVNDAELLYLLRYAAIVEDRLAVAGLGEIEHEPAVAEALERLRAGQQPSTETLNRVRDLVTDTYHPMGGIAMGTDPAASVVDSDLRVHGVANLSVASAATYPAGGSSNPTFTLMALTLRLADRLAGSAAPSGGSQ